MGLMYQMQRTGIERHTQSHICFKLSLLVDEVMAHSQAGVSCNSIHSWAIIVSASDSQSIVDVGQPDGMTCNISIRSEGDACDREMVSMRPKTILNVVPDDWTLVSGSRSSRREMSLLQRTKRTMAILFFAVRGKRLSIFARMDSHVDQVKHLEYVCQH